MISIRILLALPLLLLPACATVVAPQAPTSLTLIAVAGDEAGARIEFYRGDQAPCEGEAQRAIFIPKEGPKVNGCWRIVDPAEGVRINWLDADRDNVPPQMIRRPNGV